MFGLRSLASLTSSKSYYIPSLSISESHLDTSVNANAEKLRSHFVQHDGKKELVVHAVGTRYTVDFGALAHQMTDQLHQNVRSNSIYDFTSVFTNW